MDASKLTCPQSPKFASDRRYSLIIVVSILLVTSAAGISDMTVFMPARTRSAALVSREEEEEKMMKEFAKNPFKVMNYLAVCSVVLTSGRNG